MRILMLTPEFFPVWGGVGTYAIEIARHIPRNVELHIVTPARKDAREPLSQDHHKLESFFPPNVQIHHVGNASDAYFHTLSFQSSCLKHIPRMVKDLEIDLVHSQSSMPDLLISPTNLGAPIATTIHTTIQGHIESLRESDEGFGELSSAERATLVFGPILKAVEDAYYRKRSNFLTVSEWGKNQVAREKSINPNMISVVHNGVDTTEYSPSRANESRGELANLSSVDAPKVLYLSRFATRKGVRILAKAIPRILQKVDAHFILAGSGSAPDVDFPHDRCTFLGYLPHGVPPLLYAASDIFVLPSYYENFPISILEAMASECAVVATNVCGIPEMIDSGIDGLLVPPRDVKSLTDAIVNLVENPSQIEEMGRNAREKVTRKFTWDLSAKLTAEYYGKVIG